MVGLWITEDERNPLPKRIVRPQCKKALQKKLDSVYVCFLVTMVFCSHKLSDHPQKGLICDDVCWPSILTNPLNFQVQGRLCKIQAVSWVSLLSHQKIIDTKYFIIELWTECWKTTLTLVHISLGLMCVL